MTESVILRSGGPVQISYLSSVLTAEGLEAEVRNGLGAGVWRLVVRADQADAAREILDQLASAVAEQKPPWGAA